LNLHQGDFSTALSVSEAINDIFGDNVAVPLDASSIKVRSPKDPSQKVAFVSLLENIEVEPSRPAAKVVVNARTGTIVIGGDGSFTGALKLKDEFNFPVIGIPGTIDNDIFGTSHTLGYDTALNTVMDAIDKIRDSAISHDRLFFVEVMGKDAGYIALRSGISIGAQEILIPEVDTKINDLIDSLKNSKKSGKTSSIIVVAEGYKSGKNVYQIADEIQEKLPNYQVRVSVLGHIQRGGRPSCFDRVLGTKMGVKAVELLKNAKTGIMVGTQHGKIVTVPLKKAISEKTKIDKDLLRISKIMNT